MLHYCKIEIYCIRDLHTYMLMEFVQWSERAWYMESPGMLHRAYRSARGVCLYTQSGSSTKKGGKRCLIIIGRVQTGMCGKLPVKPIGGSRYFVTFTDDQSRYCWAYDISFKSDFIKTCVNWITMVEKQTGNYPKSLKSDNGCEYLSEEMKEFRTKQVIVQRLTAPGKPYKNGIV